MAIRTITKPGLHTQHTTTTHETVGVQVYLVGAVSVKKYWWRTSKSSFLGRCRGGYTLLVHLRQVL